LSYSPSVDYSVWSHLCQRWAPFVLPTMFPVAWRGLPAIAPTLGA